MVMLVEDYPSRMLVWIHWHGYHAIVVTEKVNKLLWWGCLAETNAGVPFGHLDKLSDDSVKGILQINSLSRPLYCTLLVKFCYRHQNT